MRPSQRLSHSRFPIEVVQAEAAYDQQTGKPVIAFRMSPTSARAFADLTAKNVGRPSLWTDT